MVEFGNAVDPAINRRVNGFVEDLRALGLPGIVQVIPTYRSAMVEYDPMIWPGEMLDQRLATLLAHRETGGAEGRLVEIPVWYDGPDLADVASHTGLSEAEVARRHAGGQYLVYAVGFSPGFAYMGGLPPELITPRLVSPRTAVPAGSVAIGGQQTGVYPSESPGGWRLIGRTCVKLFDPHRDEPSLLRAGDRVRFVQIDEAAFRAGQARAEGAAGC